MRDAEAKHGRAAGACPIYPHVIVIQHDSLMTTGDVIVAPLVAPLKMPRTRVYPLLALRSDIVMLLTPNLATFPRRFLKRPVTNLATQRGDIVAAVDMLFVGS